MESLQDQAQLMLLDHCSREDGERRSPKFRFGRLLLLLPPLRAIRGTALEELFFRKTVGYVPIQSLLCDMFRSCS